MLDINRVFSSYGKKTCYFEIPRQRPSAVGFFVRASAKISTVTLFLVFLQLMWQYTPYTLIMAVSALLLFALGSSSYSTQLGLALCRACIGIKYGVDTVSAVTK